MRPLSTERLVLRPLESSDALALHEIFRDPIAMQYFPCVQTWEETLDWLESRLQEEAMALLLQEAVIGFCGTRLARFNGGEVTELLYGMQRRFWGQGYMTEAALAIKDHLFATSRITELVCIVRPENTPSAAVATRLGMQPDASTFVHKEFIHQIWRCSAPSHLIK